MGELSELPNIGAEVERQLNLVGITTYSELKERGAKDAWIAIFAMDSSACINRLYAIEGAIRGIPKAKLDENVKAELKRFYKEQKGL